MKIHKRSLALILASLALVVGSIGGLSLAAAAPASAESSSAYSSQYPWPHNGCTRAPDAPSGVSFTYACNHHDGCYAYHWASKATCDLWFYKDMAYACSVAWTSLRGLCYAFATAYYGFVVKYGQPYYDSGGTLVRIDVHVA